MATSNGQFQKGQVPWNKGINYISIKGNKHPQWKGGMPLCLDCSKQLTGYRQKRCKNCYLNSKDTQARLKAGLVKGRPSSFKGRKHTEEAKLMISTSRKGKTAKENNPNWKGGITEPDRLERIRFRDEMQSKVFARDRYACVLCEATQNIQVDHIKGWAMYPALRFEMSNCRTLCMACHYYITFKKKLPKGVVWGHNLKRRIILLPQQS